MIYCDLKIELKSRTDYCMTIPGKGGGSLRTALLTHFTYACSKKDRISEETMIFLFCFAFIYFFLSFLFFFVCVCETMTDKQLQK